MSCECSWDGPDWDCPIHGPCQGCHYITGRMQPCDGTCDGLTEQTADQMRVEWLRANPSEAKP